MQQILIDSILLAYKKSFLSLDHLLSIKELKLVESERIVHTFGAKVNSKPMRKEHRIIIYTTAIKRWFENGCIFNGITPIDLNHAIRLVIEHEAGHIVNHILGGSGHDAKFKEIVNVCYGHTGSTIIESSMVKEKTC